MCVFWRINRIDYSKYLGEAEEVQCLQSLQRLA